MRGWLEGLGQDAVRGQLDVFLHEGLFDMKGELEVFHKRTEHNLSLVLSMIERRVIGLSHKYPKSNFRLRISYTTEWLTEST